MSAALGGKAVPKPILIFYHIPADGDEAEPPNAFPVLKAGTAVKLQDIRAKFPLQGTYHFRFKMKFGETSSVWMDVTNEDSQVPMYDGKIIAKVTRVSWNSEAENGAKAADGVPKPAVQNSKATQPPPPSDGLLFDDDTPSRGPVSTPAVAAGAPRAAPPAAAQPPPPAPGRHDEFDMLFG
mmetsp:Transcript_90700/g.171057  ORF Transcript_90700/g.171057 Transcript_90700/m.171057 type:complete len:181 (-) Transcript_90700:53-595(-)